MNSYLKCFSKENKGYKDYGVDKCHKCQYWSKAYNCCDYLEIKGTIRPCPPNHECTEFKARRRRRSASEKAIANE